MDAVSDMLVYFYRVSKERGFLWSLMQQFLLTLESVPATGEC